MRKVLPAVFVPGLRPLAACRAKEDAPNVPALITDLQSTDTVKSGQANLELIRVGEPAVPGLVEMLKSGDPHLRSLAASAFWGMGEKARTAAPALAEALSDPDPAFRPQVATAPEH